MSKIIHVSRISLHDHHLLIKAGYLVQIHSPVIHHRAIKPHVLAKLELKTLMKTLHDKAVESKPKK